MFLEASHKKRLSTARMPIHFLCQIQTTVDPFIHLCPTTEEHVNSLHDVILLWVVRVLFAGDLQYGRDGLVVILQYMSNIIGNVLCNQNDANVIPLGEFLKGLLHLNQLRVGLNNEKVGGIGRSVANSSEEETGDGILHGPTNANIQGEGEG